MNPLSQNPKLKGLKRDNLLLQTIEDWRVLNTQQVQAMFFNKMKYGKRKSQDVLLRLHRRGKLNRSRGDDCYYYYLTGKPPGMIKHLLATNWVRLWFQQQCPSWERLHSWVYEQDYKILRADGFAAVKNVMTGKYRFTFVEMDRATNSFNKVQIYNKLFDHQDKHLLHWWWFALTEVFPTILIVTTSPTSKNAIQGQIEALNKNKLVITVELLDNIQKEVMEKCCSPMSINGLID